MALEQYTAMQEEHLEALRRGNLREMSRWQAERERAFTILQRALDGLGDLRLLKDQGLVQHLRERIGALLARENLLRKQVRDHRQRTREQLASLRKGRQAVRRLGTQPEATPRPRFISNLA
ncbi:hypothetical protein [Desulfurivibrio alkaliphilus]|nr:hypothetical protein [Desulfurivibrio alkaliphilus]